MITYVLIISKKFPKFHKKEGIPTKFVEQINSLAKIHTIRGNYELWKKRFKKIKKGEACLSVRYWEDKPYKSSQIEFLNLKKTDGISIEKLEFYEDKDDIPALKYPIINNYAEPNIKIIAENDGLNYSDFKEWFKNYDLSKPLAIIHFTHFRYT